MTVAQVSTHCFDCHGNNKQHAVTLDLFPKLSDMKRKLGNILYCFVSVNNATLYGAEQGNYKKIF